MYKYLLITLMPLLFCQCLKDSGTETCNDCDVALLDYFNSLGNNCVADDGPVLDNCSSFRHIQGVGLMRESCLQGNAEQAFCNNTGRSAAPFYFATWRAVPKDVRVDMTYGGHTESINVTNLTDEVRVFDGFLPANALVDVKMYDANTGDLLASATPKISYARTENNLSKEREVWVDYLTDTDEWRFYFLLWE